MSSILIIGCVSLDTIHLEQSAGRKKYNTVGGAGLFTALASAHGGAQVTLYAPKPSPMPDLLIAVDKAINWIGPPVVPDQMPTLEIAHHGEGRATLIAASWGPEKLLTAKNLYQETKLMDNKVEAFDAIHIAALSTAQRQFEFLQLLIDKSASHLISVGTYARAITADRNTVRRLLAKSNAFFMNKNEAGLLLEGGEVAAEDHQMVVVTDGKNGATVYQPRSSEHIQATPADELDPTGAGDTFCGATLAGLTQKLDAAQAARLGAQLAARIIEHPGSEFYF